MPDSESTGSGKKDSFWTTLPGVLTGIAALITAVTGLWLAMGSHGSTPKPEPVAVTTGTEPATKPSQQPASSMASASPTPATIPPPATVGSVVVTSRAGEVTKLSPKTFIHNGGDKALPLTSGQTISFEKIKAIDFLDAHYDQHIVDVKVTLNDGRVVTGDLQKDYAFNGDSDLGPFTIFMTEVKQVTFNQ